MACEDSHGGQEYSGCREVLFLVSEGPTQVMQPPYCFPDSVTFRSGLHLQASSGEQAVTRCLCKCTFVQQPWGLAE